MVRPAKPTRYQDMEQEEIQKQVKEIQTQVNATHKMMTEVHFAVFGVEGQGGIMRDLECKGKRITKLENYVLPGVGIIIALPVVVTIVLHLLSK